VLSSEGAELTISGRRTYDYYNPACKPTLHRKSGKGGGRNRGREITRVCTINQPFRGALIKKFIKIKIIKGKQKIPIIASMRILLTPNESIPI
jgi:hypothetical protein